MDEARKAVVAVAIAIVAAENAVTTSRILLESKPKFNKDGMAAPHKMIDGTLRYSAITERSLPSHIHTHTRWASID